MTSIYLRGLREAAKLAALGLCDRGVPAARRLTQNRAHPLGRPCARFSVCTVASSQLSPSTTDGASHVSAVESKIGGLDTGLTVPPPSPLVVVISGPSGVGKDAVIRRLQELRPDLYFVVTATSRPVRPGEQHGVDYLFVSKGQFEEWIEAGQLLEYALVYGDYKGIPRTQVEEALQRGTDVVLRLDVQGAATVRRLLPSSVSIFLVAESESELVHRLVARKTEPLDKLLVRVETARSELKRLHEFDYVVVNQDGKLDGTVQAIQAVIQAEKSRVTRLLPRSTREGTVQE